MPLRDDVFAIDAFEYSLLHAITDAIAFTMQTLRHYHIYAFRQPATPRRFTSYADVFAY